MRKVLVISILAGLELGLAGCKQQPDAPESKRPDVSDVRAVGNGANDVEGAPAAASAAAKVSAAAAINDKRPLLVCFGDSLTAGYGTDPGQSYPDYLQADLNRMGYGYRVVNEGISGNTTKDGVERLDEIVAMKPAIVVLEFGGNDGLRGLRIEDTRRNMEQMVAGLKAAHVPVVLAGITLPPDYGQDYIAQFNATYSMLAKKYSVPMLPFLLKGVFGVPGMMQRDATHATAKGNEIVAKNVLGLVQPYLKKR